MIDWSAMGKGMFSGIITRIAIEPFDLLKVRMELNEAPKPAGIMTTIKTVYKQEGLLAFWKGNVFGVWLYATYTGIQFFTFENLKNAGLNPFNRGMISGIVATILSYPFDVLRTRAIIRRNRTLSLQNSVATIHKIYQYEGLAGFWKGMGPTLLAVAPATGISFWAFNACGSFFDSIGGNFTVDGRDIESWWVNLLSGAIAGAASKTTTMPLDVVRKRMQVQSPLYKEFATVTSPYKNTAVAVKQIWAHEGFRGFYKGLSVALLKTIPATAIAFASYHALQN